MNPFSHRKVQTLLQADPPLETHDRRMVAAHLSACSDCRAYAGVIDQLESVAWNPYSPTGLPAAEEQQIARRLFPKIKKRQRVQRWLAPVPVIAWGVILILLVVGLNWTLDNLLPQSGTSSPVASSPWVARSGMPGLNPNLPQPEINVQGPDITRLFQWMFEHLVISLLAFPLLLAGVGMLFGLRAGSEKANKGWLWFLLIALMALYLLHLVLVPWDGYGVTVWLLTPMVVITSSAIMHLWTARQMWSRRLFIQLVIYLAALVLLLAIPWWPSHIRGVFPGIFLAAILPVVVWQAGEWRGWPRRVALFGLVLLVISLAGVLLLSPYQKMFLPSWLQAIFVVAQGLWVFIGTILAGRVVYSSVKGELAFHWSRDRWQIILRLVVLAIILSSIRVLIMRATYNDLTSEEQLGAILLAVVAVCSAIIVSIPMSWKLTAWRKMAPVVYVFVVLITLVPAARLPGISAQELTSQRAEAVNQAIQSYYEKNNHYPASLAELSPRYLWNIAKPATQWDHNFCYQAGEGFYRLGYVDQSNPRIFRDFSIVVYAAQGDLPDTTWVCDQELEQARAREQEYWQFMQ